jgi:hypothetical protein
MTNTAGVLSEMANWYNLEHGTTSTNYQKIVEKYMQISEGYDVPVSSGVVKDSVPDFVGNFLTHYVMRIDNSIAFGLSTSQLS